MVVPLPVLIFRLAPEKGNREQREGQWREVGLQLQSAKVDKVGYAIDRWQSPSFLHSVDSHSQVGVHPKKGG